MALKELAYIQENVNLEGNKEVTLVINCINCPEKVKNLFLSRKCKFCYLDNLYKYNNRKFNYISILCDDLLIDPNQFNMFLDYFKKLKKIKRINKKIENIRIQNCQYREFTCKIFPEYSLLYKIKDIEYLDPTLVYDHILKRIGAFKKKKIVDPLCQKCLNNYENLENILMDLFSALRIIKTFKKYQNNYVNPYNKELFYKYLFSKNLFSANKNNEKENFPLIRDWELIHTYEIGENEIFNVCIQSLSDENEKRYIVNPFFKGKENEDYFNQIIQDIRQNLEIGEFDKLIPFENLVEIYKNEAIKYINSKYDFSLNDREKIGMTVALRVLNLDDLFPLLIDDYIEEIFLDSPNDEIYINHQTYGRCRTGIRFNLKLIDRIKTLFRLYSGKRLDFMNPTIKFVMKNKYFYCRFSIDVEPIQIKNFALDIRKLNKNILTIQDLLKNGTLDPLIAAFLYFNILRRKNITATGETDTGKTTLINAFDLLTPKEFRKIYVENVIESLNQQVYGKHQLKYKVDSLKISFNEKYSKSNQIKTLLHRTPDIIYLGEILTEEEAKAMFHCLAAGLRGFQTIHAKNLDSLLNRFLYHFKIDQSCLNDMDLIILMKKEHNERRIMGVFEIFRDNEEPNKLYAPIFKYNPESQKWDIMKPLYDTNAINELRTYENLSKEKFSTLIEIYKDIFEFVLKGNRIDNKELTDFFHKISFYSFKSISLLISYWTEWKKNRSLNF